MFFFLELLLFPWEAAKWLLVIHMHWRLEATRSGKATLMGV